MAFGIRQGMALAWLSSIVISSRITGTSSAKATFPHVWKSYVDTPDNEFPNPRDKREETVVTKAANHDIILQVYNEYFDKNIKDKLDNVPCYMVLRGTGAKEWEFQIAKLTRLVVKAVLNKGDDVDANIHCPHPSGCKEFEDEEYCGCPPLYLAVKWEEAELLMSALDKSADTNVTCGIDIPLFLVSSSWDIIKLTIDNETNLNTWDDAGENLLHKWAHYGLISRTESNDQILDYLLMRGIDINGKNSAGDTALLITADAVPADLGYNDKNDDRFLGNKNILAKVLLNRGADIEARNNRSWTSLHIATHHCNIGLVRKLLGAGADINPSNGDGETALHIAVNHHVPKFDEVRQWNKMTIDEIRKHISSPNFYSSIRKSLYCANLTMPTLLIQAGADPNAKQEDGWTPLHLAVYYMNFDLAKLLLDSGANVNVMDVIGCTPLHLAVMRSVNISALLVRHEANVNVKQTNGWTPLHLAVFYQELDTALMLIRNGADVNAKQNQGWTPWMIANRMDHLEISEMLEHYGAEKKLFFRVRNSARRWWESLSGLWKSQCTEPDLLANMLLYDGFIGLWKCKTSYSELFDH